MEKGVKEKEKMPIFGKSIQFLNKNFGWEKQWKSVFAETNGKPYTDWKIWMQK